LAIERRSRAVFDGGGTGGMDAGLDHLLVGACLRLPRPFAQLVHCQSDADRLRQAAVGPRKQEKPPRYPHRGRLATSPERGRDAGLSVGRGLHI
jgi:hypothetical protein